MLTTDIKKIIQILQYRRRHDLSSLLKNSTSQLNESSTYGSHLFSTLSTFDIYSPIENYEKLKNLNEKDRKEILNAVLEIYPPREYSPEITELRFYLDINIEKEEEGLLATCTHCGAPQGLFTDLGELRKKIALQKNCIQCKTKFSFLSNGSIWNLNWEILPNKQEYIIKLLEEEIKEKQQFIFCYENLSKESKQYRYPQKRMKFSIHERTERASPAYALNIFTKETGILEKSYCFDSPYALLQIAREAIKGIYWLKYDKKD